MEPSFLGTEFPLLIWVRQRGRWSKRPSIRFSKILSIQHGKSILKNMSFGFGTTIRTELPETVAQNALVIRLFLLQTVSHNQLHRSQKSQGIPRSTSVPWDLWDRGRQRERLLNRAASSNSPDVPQFSYVPCWLDLAWPWLVLQPFETKAHAPKALLTWDWGPSPHPGITLVAA